VVINHKHCSVVDCVPYLLWMQRIAVNFCGLNIDTCGPKKICSSLHAQRILGCPPSDCWASLVDLVGPHLRIFCSSYLLTDSHRCWKVCV
jgi:hypothetical protein